LEVNKAAPEPPGGGRDHQIEGIPNVASGPCTAAPRSELTVPTAVAHTLPLAALATKKRHAS